MGSCEKVLLWCLLNEEPIDPKKAALYGVLCKTEGERCGYMTMLSGDFLTKKGEAFIHRKIHAYDSIIETIKENNDL